MSALPLQACPGCQGLFPCGAEHSCQTHSFKPELSPEIREILRDVAAGVTGPDLRGRAAAAIGRRDLCPRCAGTGMELLQTPPGAGVAWGNCHGCPAGHVYDSSCTNGACSACGRWHCMSHLRPGATSLADLWDCPAPRAAAGPVDAEKEVSGG